MINGYTAFIYPDNFGISIFANLIKNKKILFTKILVFPERLEISYIKEG
jgi:hypothetical protein